MVHLTFEVNGFGSAKGSATFSAEASANGEIRGLYKKLSGNQPGLWSYDYHAGFEARLNEVSLHDLSLPSGSFGAEFRLVPKMDVLLVGTSFPFVGLDATTTAQIVASAGFQISTVIPPANINVEVTNPFGTAGEDLTIKLSWKDIPRDRQDIINVFMHNDCWDDSVKHPILKYPHYFEDKRGSLTLKWSVPFDATLSQLKFMDTDIYGGFNICNAQKYCLSVSLAKDGSTIYHSNEFALRVNTQDVGFGVTIPSSNVDLYSDENNLFQWKSEGFEYFQSVEGAGESVLKQIETVQVYLHSSETDCTISPLINGIIELFDSSWGCSESWDQIAQNITNDGDAFIFVPSTTLDGKAFTDFDEVFASVIGVENTNVYSKNQGTFNVRRGCTDKRYGVTFTLQDSKSKLKTQQKLIFKRDGILKRVV